jgi:hypothetical protein
MDMLSRYTSWQCSSHHYGHKHLQLAAISSRCKRHKRITLNQEVGFYVVAGNCIALCHLYQLISSSRLPLLLRFFGSIYRRSFPNPDVRSRIRHNAYMRLNDSLVPMKSLRRSILILKNCSFGSLVV